MKDRRVTVLAALCPRCGAPPTTTCRTPKGRPVPPHIGRRQQVTLEEAYKSSIDPTERLGLRLAMRRYDLLKS